MEGDRNTASSASSSELSELAVALVEAQAEFDAVPKDSSNPFFKSSYAALPQVVAAASPVLTKHGLAVSQFLGYDGQQDTLTTWLIHKSGQYIKQTMRLHLVKDDPQAQGSATTYARRYSYMAVLGLVADEDDDGNAATQAVHNKPTQREASLSVASAKQMSYLESLMKQAGFTPEQIQGGLAKVHTKAEAADAIDKMQNKILDMEAANALS